MKKIIIITIAVFIQTFAFSQKMTREEYIEKYKKIAIEEMKRSGVPASITLAQGLLESDNGNSKLARKANNHFGIKCHSDWKGKTMHKTDDKRHECFRKYNSVKDSYEDHSDFLKKPRYSDLFDLEITDYKSWAKGLKKAGYATNPKYPQLLITIIEDNELYKFDKEKYQSNENDISAKSKVSKKKTKISTISKNRKIKTNNRIKYIVVKKGDTFAKLNEELGLMSWQLPKYNEISKNTELFEGQKLYLQPKRSKADKKYKYHKVKEGETMYSISQKYGIKLDKLYAINIMSKGTEPKTGDKIWLRKKK